jgi:hypothetical protein
MDKLLLLGGVTAIGYYFYSQASAVSPGAVSSSAVFFVGFDDSKLLLPDSRFPQPIG